MPLSDSTEEAYLQVCQHCSIEIVSLADMLKVVEMTRIGTDRGYFAIIVQIRHVP